MSVDILHPMVDFDANDRELRTFPGAFGQTEEIELERFYWVHLDWYEANGILDDGGIAGLVIEIDEERGTQTIADGLRVLVDHHLIPNAIRQGIPPFDEISRAEREEFLSSLMGAARRS